MLLLLVQKQYHSTIMEKLQQIKKYLQMIQFIKRVVIIFQLVMIALLKRLNLQIHQAALIMYLEMVTLMLLLLQIQ
nr:MAG TPA: hypothetical protein [Caudoviricetes sp.]